MEPVKPECHAFYDRLAGRREIDFDDWRHFSHEGIRYDPRVLLAMLQKAGWLVFKRTLNGATITYKA